MEKEFKEKEEKEIFPKEIQTLIAGIFPNTRYFDVNFEHLQFQINVLRQNQEEFKKEMEFRFGLVDKKFEDVNRRFEVVNRRFEDVNRRFEETNEVIKEFKKDVDDRFEQVYEVIREFKTSVDKRFEQVDKRFEQIIASIDKLSDKLDNRDNELRGFTLKMFSIAIGVSVLGVLGAFFKIMGVF